MFLLVLDFKIGVPCFRRKWRIRQVRRVIATRELSVRVSILLFEGAIALPSIGSLELLQKSFAMGGRDDLRAELVAITDRNVTSVEGITIPCHRCVDEIKQTDLVLIPALDGEILQQLERAAHGVPWVRAMYKAGADVASICTGAFVLAETGLLDGRHATTHWSAQSLFRERYPQVELLGDQIIVDEGRIITCGGATSFLNLLMYLVEKYCGRETALEASRMFLIDLNKGPQSAYAIFSTQKNHGDEAVLRAQQVIESDSGSRITTTELASMLAMSRRNLERRFKIATGNSVLEYAQRLRIERAKKSLESSLLSISEIAETVGYTDSASFRRLFTRSTGMNPSEYRRRYGSSVPTGSVAYVRQSAS